jgi:two-component system response regulator LytT
MSLKAICVDDESPALSLIKKYAVDIPELELMDCFNSAADAIEFLKHREVDLLILDIQMPIISGIEMVKMIPEGKMVIFITADPSHAAQAFDLDVIDYLVKPVLPERFNKAVQKALDYSKYLDANYELEYIVFKSDYMINKLKIEEVQWVEGYGEYLKIITRFKHYLVLQRLTDFLEKYQELGFIRIHKSYIILRNTIASYSSQLVILKSGKQLPIGRTFKDNI